MVDEPSNEKKGAHLIISLSSFPSSSSSSLGLEDRIVPFGVSQSFSLLLRRSVRIGYCRLNVGTILVAHLYNKVVEKSHWLDGSSKAQLDQAQVLKPSRSSPAGATEGKDALVELFVQLRLREHNPPRNKSQMKQKLTNILDKHLRHISQKSNETKFDKHLVPFNNDLACLWLRRSP